MTTLIVLASVIGYILMGVISAAIVHSITDNDFLADDGGFQYLLGGLILIFWPILFPFLIIVCLVKAAAWIGEELL